MQAASYNSGWRIFKYAYDHEILIITTKILQEWILSKDGDHLAMMFRCFMCFCKHKQAGSQHIDYFIVGINKELGALDDLINKMQFFAKIEKKTQEILFNYQQKWNDVVLKPITAEMSDSIMQLNAAINTGSIQDITTQCEKTFGVQVNLEFIFRVLLQEPACNVEQKLIQDFKKDEELFLSKLLQCASVLQILKNKTSLDQVMVCALNNVSDLDMNTALFLFEYAIANNITLDFSKVGRGQLVKFFTSLFIDDCSVNNKNAQKMLDMLEIINASEIDKTAIRNNCLAIRALDPKIKIFLFTYIKRSYNYLKINEIIQLNVDLGSSINPNNVALESLLSLQALYFRDDKALGYLRAPDPASIVVAIKDKLKQQNIFTVDYVRNNRDEFIRIIDHFNDTELYSWFANFDTGMACAINLNGLRDMLQYAKEISDSEVLCKMCKFALIYGDMYKSSIDTTILTDEVYAIIKSAIEDNQVYLDKNKEYFGPHNAFK